MENGQNGRLQKNKDFILLLHLRINLNDMAYQAMKKSIFGTTLKTVTREFMLLFYSITSADRGKMRKDGTPDRRREVRFWAPLTLTMSLIWR